MCASWLAVDGDDQEIMGALLKHAEVLLDAADSPSPPKGYPSWLDFAVDTMDTRTEEQERLFDGTPASRQSMQDAARAELVALRRKAGEILALSPSLCAGGWSCRIFGLQCSQ